MSTHAYWLTDHEKSLIDRDRQRAKERKELIEKQANCNHEWRYVCACHNDDAYECRKCGASEFR